MKMPADFWDRVAEKVAAKIVFQTQQALSAKLNVGLGGGGLQQHLDPALNEQINRAQNLQNLASQQGHLSDAVQRFWDWCS